MVMASSKSRAFITASTGADNFRFTSAAESTGSGMDQITNFDATADHFVFEGVSGFAGPINFVGTNAFSGNSTTPSTEARLEGSFLQIDVDGDGQMTEADIQVNLINLNGQLTNNNFLIL